jgi:putative peptide zinc metalloprotease protein
MTVTTGLAPALAPGVQLLGEYQGSGFTEPHYLIARADQQVLHVSRLLFLVASHIDGHSSSTEIGQRVTQEYGRVLTDEGVELLIEKKLAPMGLIAVPEGGALQPSLLEAYATGSTGAGSASIATPGIASGPASTGTPQPPGGRSPTTARPPRANPLLSIRFRGTLVPARLTNVLARLLRPLFFGPIVVLVVLALVGADLWLATSSSVLSAFGAVVLDPPLLLAVVGILLASTLFHELGHAAACRAGGARPGTIGVAVYVVYPAFFTDVTDSYRLGRAGRVRTDLGGVYFNAISILVLTWIYTRTLSPVVLLAIVLVHVELLQQLIPLGRLDGYFVLADLAGVPDLFSRIGPILASLLPGRRLHPKVAELRRSARVIVTIWVVVCVPVMAVLLGLLFWSAPSMSQQIAEGMTRSWGMLQDAFPRQDWPAVAVATLSLVLLPLPLLGMTWLVVGTLRRLLTAIVRRLRRRTASGRRSGAHRGPSTRTRRTPTHTAAELARSERPVPRPRPTRGLARRCVYALSHGHLNPGPGAVERQQNELRERVRTRFTGTRRIVVLSRKGGAGKTTTTLMLGRMLASCRPDRVVALDANADAGSLAMQLPRESSYSATDLLADRAWVERYTQVRAYTTQDPDSGLEVVASDSDAQAGQYWGRQDSRDLIDTLDRHYSLMLADTRTGILDDATQGLLEEADQLVLVVPPTLDGARIAAMSLDWLDRHGYEFLVWNAVVVVNGVRQPRSEQLQRLENHFRSRCGSVLRVPWDEALDGERYVSFSDLRAATQQAYLEVAAAVADNFPTSVRLLAA